MLQCDNKIR